MSEDINKKADELTSRIGVLASRSIIELHRQINVFIPYKDWLELGMLFENEMARTTQTYILTAHGKTDEEVLERVAQWMFAACMDVIREQYIDGRGEWTLLAINGKYEVILANEINTMMGSHVINLTKG